LPEHVNVHDAPAAHDWVQRPPEHVNVHDWLAAQIWSQPPPLHVALQLVPAHSSRHPPRLQV
jgi:hypothetical protein